MGQKLFVGSLSFSTTSDSLKQFFTQCGTVTSATVITDQMSGRSRGFGFVEMSSQEEASQAVSRLNGKELDGRQIKVEEAKPAGSGGGGGRGPSGGGRFGGRPGQRGAGGGSGGGHRGSRW